MMKQKILITGASGFIGSFIVEEALNRDFEIWAGIRSTSSKKYLKDNRIHFLELSFNNPDRLSEQLSDCKKMSVCWDYIIHCAGVTKCKDKDGFDKGNYVATKNFIEALQSLDMIPRQFIYISSLSVYGPIHEKTYEPIKDTDIPKPNTAYGISKIKTEQYIRNLQAFPYVIFRPTGVYGPREKDYFLMAKSIKQHIDFAAGFERQDLTFIYVKDLVKALFLAIEQNVTQKAYFVSDGEIYPSRAFSDYIQKELGNPFVIHIKCPLFILKIVSLLAGFVAALLGKSSTLNADKYKIMKQRNWQCDISPLVNDLGFKPEYPLKRGVKETIAWYKKEKWL